MPQTFTEGSLTFEFPDTWRICRPEECAYYYRHFQGFCGGAKEVDFLAYDPGSKILWLIEVKDYSWFRRSKSITLEDEIASKIRDVLAFMVAGGANDKGSSPSQAMSAYDFWPHARGLGRLRVVLHCELPARPSKLFPGVKDAANMQSKLAAMVRCIDPHPIVVSRTSGPVVPWSVS